MGDFYGNQHTTGIYDEYGYEELVSDVRDLAERLGHPPTTREADDDEELPSLGTMYSIIDDDWPSVLRDAGVTPTEMQRRSRPSDRRERMLADLRDANRRTDGHRLRTRQYDDQGSFATSSVKATFGSWAHACEAAGIDCGTKHGVACRGPNGATLDSRHERAVARLLDDHGIAYETHPAVGDRWAADFYLVAADLLVEVDGYADGTRPNQETFERKLAFLKARDMDFVVVETTDELARALRRRDIIPDR